MHDADTSAPEPTETSPAAVTRRRTALKGAAWSLPVIAAAVTAPTVAASVNDLSLAWTAQTSTLLALDLLDEPAGGSVTAATLITVPTQLTVSNGPGAVNTTGTLTITITRPSGISITAGRGRGFGVRSFNGTASTTGERTVTYPGNLGLPNTTFTRTIPVVVGSNGAVNFPVTYGLAGARFLITVNVLAVFGVTATLVVNGRTLTATSSIQALANAGVL